MSTTSLTLYDYHSSWEVDCPIRIAKHFDYLSVMMEDEEAVRIGVMDGDTSTSEQTQQAVEAMRCLLRLDAIIDEVNEGNKPLHEMYTLLPDVDLDYSQWKALSTKNEVYMWLAPSMELIRKVETNYTNHTLCPIAWMKTHDRSQCDSQKAFASECKEGHLELAQWLVSLGGVDIHAYDEGAFRGACYKGHLELAQWLVSLGGVDIHAYDEGAFRGACYNGHLELAQWLVSLGGIDIHANEAFRWACGNGHLEVAQWLVSLGGIDIHANDEGAFRGACYNGHLELAKWVYSLGGVDIHEDDDEAFRWTCGNGHLEVAQWLVSLGGIDIHIYNDIAFCWARNNGHLKVAQWLVSLF